MSENKYLIRSHCTAPMQRLRQWKQNWPSCATRQLPMTYHMCLYRPNHEHSRVINVDIGVKTGDYIDMRRGGKMSRDSLARPGHLNTTVWPIPIASRDITIFSSTTNRNSFFGRVSPWHPTRSRRASTVPWLPRTQRSSRVGVAGSCIV